MINVLVMFVLTFLSFIGYGMFVRYKFNIAPAAIPIFLFSSTVVVLFIAGILNLLQSAAYVIFVAGLLLFVYSIFTYVKKGLRFSELLTPSTVFFFAFCAVAVFLLEDSLFLHYDNFSHWAMIVKELFLSNSLPDDSSVITYKNYPPGAALFVYYIVTITGFSESMALIAQAILIGGALTTILLFSSWKKPFSIIGFLFVPFTLLLVESPSFYTLLVDSLLAYIAIAIVFIAYYYRNQWLLMTIVTMPVSSLLILTKDSGKIFFAFCIIWIISLLISNLKHETFGAREKMQNIGYTIAYTICIPLFINLLWSRYIEKAYSSDYADNKFAITNDTLSEVKKSPEFVQSLLPNLLEASFDFSSNVFQAMVLVNVIAVFSIVVITWANRRFATSLFLITLFVNLFYLLYTGLLYVLYLYLMPEVEAVYLAGFSRYQSSAAIFFIGILMTFVLYEWANKSVLLKSTWLPKSIGVLLSILLIFPLIGHAEDLFKHENEAAQSRFKAVELLSQLRTEEKISENTPITLIYDIGKSDRGFLRHVMNYERMSRNTTTFTFCHSEEDREKIASALENSSYLMILEIDSEMKQCIAEYSEIDNIESGNYKIEDGVISSKIGS